MRIPFQLLTLTLTLTLTGCAPCGSFVLSGTNTTDFEGHGYNGRWFESCGTNAGSSATWNLFGDERAYIDFTPDALGARAWRGIDIELEVSFPLTELVDGAEITDLEGGAALNTCASSCLTDEAWLTAGTITVRSLRGADAPCEGEGPVASLSWDLTYGEEGGPLYELRGTDKLRFSNFLSESCDD